jgi:hypothetical protein
MYSLCVLLACGSFFMITHMCENVVHKSCVWASVKASVYVECGLAFEMTMLGAF